MREDHYLVPKQTEGFENNIEQSITTDGIDDAEDLFVEVKERLVNVNKWSEFARFTNVDLKLADAKGHYLHRQAHSADHIMAEIKEAEASVDWLIIQAMEYDDYPDDLRETFAIHMQPIDRAANEATATIVIDRTGKKVTISYHGRNRSAVTETAKGGKWSGLSREQWGGLILGLLK